MNKSNQRSAKAKAPKRARQVVQNNKQRKQKQSNNRVVRRAQPPWLTAVLDPFGTYPASVPDEQVFASIKGKSSVSTAFATSDATGSSASHGACICIAPMPFGANVSIGNFTSGSTTFTTWADLLNTVPNFNALFPTSLVTGGVTSDSYRFRCTAMSAKLTYDGTELNRAGAVTAGLAEMDSGYTVGYNASAYCLGQSYVLLAGTTPQTVLTHMKNYVVDRDPDGSTLVTSVPSGCPLYQTLTIGAGVPSGHDINAANSIPGIVFVIQGDNTSAAGAVGNTWSLDVCWHWEIIPASAVICAVPPTPSPCDIASLQQCLNTFQAITPVVVAPDAGVITSVNMDRPIRPFTAAQAPSYSSTMTSMGTMAASAAASLLGLAAARRRAH